MIAAPAPRPATGALSRSPRLVYWRGMKQGLVEYALVTAFLALAAAGAIAIFGDEIRGALGLRQPARGTPAPVPPALPAPAPR